MRILHVTDTYAPTIGGIELHVRDLAAGQRQDGHQVSVLTRGRSEEARPWVLTTRHGGPARAGRGLGDLVRTAAPDVVHVHLSVWSPLGWQALRLAAEAGVPTVSTAHSLTTGFEGLYRTGDSALRLARLPVAWTAVSSVAARSFRRALGDRVEVGILHNAVDVDWWGANITPPTARDGLPLRIAVVGRLAHRKRPLAALDAVADAAASLPPGSLQLTLVGDGPLRARLERRARHQPFAVRLLGAASREDIRRLLGRTDVLLAPARRESFGLAALEAQAAGVPVIALRQSGIAEFVRPGTSGLLVDDYAQVADAITRLARDRPLRRHLAAGAPASAAAFTWDVALRRTEDTYLTSGAWQRSHPAPRKLLALE